MRKRSREEKKEKTRKRKRRSLGIWVTLLLMLVAAAAVFLVFRFGRETDSVKILSGAYYYFGERKVEYEGDLTLWYKDREVVLEDKDGKHPLDTKPLYIKEGGVILPYAYSWYGLKTGTIFQLPHFSQIKIENNAISLIDGNRRTESAGGFLFDGIDTYLFLEAVEIEAGGEAVRLPALSYAVARYGNTLQYFAYGTGESVVLPAKEGEQTASFINGDGLNMGTDTLKRANGTWQLLVVDPEKMQRMEQ